MKILTTLTIILFMSTGLMAQVNAKYHMSKKGQKEYVIKKQSNVIEKTLESYEFVYNEKSGAYESTYLSWTHQYIVKIKKKRKGKSKVILECYATANVKYADKRNAYKTFKAFNKLIRWGIENNMVQPTTPEELWGWKHNRTTTTVITLIKKSKL